MFTRCPKCQTVFRVSAAVLQMADGDVRCGSCSDVFNALHTLVDDWTGTSFPGAALSAPVEVESQPLEDFEFNVPEDEWQKFFIGPAGARAPRQEPALGADFDHAPGTAEPGPTRSPPEPRRSIEEETADTDTWQSFLREADVEPALQPPAAVEPLADDDDEQSDAAEAVFVIGTELGANDVLVRQHEVDDGPSDQDEVGDDTREMRAVVAEPAAAASEAETALDAAAPVDDPVAIESIPEVATAATAEEAEYVEPEFVESPGLREETSGDTVLDWGPSFPEREPRAPTQAGRWLAASVVAALTLGAQAVHQARDRLAVDATWGNAVREVYRRLDLPLHPEWPLEAYEIRDMKAIADNSAPGGLDIVAEIAVNGTATVGLPVLRVVLRDRWSNPVSSGSFVATDYLAERAPPDRLYGPGSLIPVQLTLRDPGTAAQGYELDVCMPNRQRGLICRNLRDPFKR